MSTWSNDDTKYFSTQGGKITLSSKYKPEVITDIQVWTDAILVYAFMYVLAHPDCSTALFKHTHIIRLGASHTEAPGWKNYDMQFCLKRENVIQTCHLLLLTKGCGFCTCTAFWLFKGLWHSPPTTLNVLNSTVKVNAKKVYANTSIFRVDT